MIHIIFFIFFGTLLKHVKNRELYLTMWIDRQRCIIIPIHFLVFFGMTKTLWLGGMASDLCLFLYLYEHYDILGKINEKHNFMFISRGRRNLNLMAE
jgi:hypothetical protein